MLQQRLLIRGFWPASCTPPCHADRAAFEAELDDWETDHTLPPYKAIAEYEKFDSAFAEEMNEARE